MPEPSRRQPWAIGESELVQELLVLRTEGLTSLLDRKLAIPNLLRIAKLLSPSTPEVREYKLIDRLLHTLLGTDAYMKGHNRREAASHYFGHSEEMRGKSNEQRMRHVASDYFFKDPGTFRRPERGGDERQFVRQIAEALVDLEKAISNVTPETSAFNGVYIDREELSLRFDAVWQTSSLISLVGDAGTGKSRFAFESGRLARSTDGKQLVLRAGSPRKFHDDILMFLRKHGTDIRGMQDVVALRTFTDFLLQSEEPLTVVIDNVEDFDLIGDVSINKLSKSKVITTSRILPPRGSAWVAVEVPCLQVAEAVAMIQSRMPELPSADVKALARRLDGRPLAIEHSCAYLSESGMRVTAFCSALEVDLAETLDGLSSPTDATLTAIYFRITEYLRQRPNALRALDLIVHADPYIAKEALALLWKEPMDIVGPLGFDATGDQLPPDFPLESVVGGFFSDPPIEYTLAITSTEPEPISMISLHKGIRILEHFSLVREVDGYIEMHMLTKEIVARLRRDERDSIYSRILQTASLGIDSFQWRGGGVLPWSHLLWLPHIKVALEQMDLDLYGDERLHELAWLTAVAIRGSRQVGWRTPSHLMTIGRTILDRIALWEADKDADGYVVRPEVWALLIEMIEAAVHIDIASTEMHTAFLYLAKQLPPKPSFDLLLSDDWQPAQTLYSFTALHSFRQQVTERRYVSWHSVAEIADHNLRRGACFAQIGDMASAAQCYEDAFQDYGKLGGSAEYIRRMIEVGRCLAQVNLRRGKPELSEHWHEEALRVKGFRSGSTVNGERSRFQVIDIVMDARLAHTAIDIDFYRLTSSREAPNASTSGAFDAIAQNYSNVVDQYNKARSLRLVPQATLGYFTSRHASEATGFTEVDQHGLRQLMDGMGSFCDQELKRRRFFGAARCQLSSLKMAANGILPGDWDFLAEIDDPNMRQLVLMQLNQQKTLPFTTWRLAQKFRNRFHSYYWYFEALGTACAIGNLASKRSRFMTELRSEYVAVAMRLGRQDRLEQVLGTQPGDEVLWLLSE